MTLRSRIRVRNNYFRQHALFVYLLIFSRVSDTREDGYSNRQVEQQDADLTITVLQRQRGGKARHQCGESVTNAEVTVKFVTFVS